MIDWLIDSLIQHTRAAWYWRGWITAIHCFTAHVSAVSRHYSACRTTLKGLFCKHRGSATQTHCCASSTGCRFVTESTTTWLWWLTRSTALVYLHTRVITSTLANQHEHYVHMTLDTLLFTMYTIHQDWACEACFPVLSSSAWDSLPSFIPTAALWRPSNLGWKLTFSVYHSTVAYTSDLITFLPAPLKLRPYGAI